MRRVLALGCFLLVYGVAIFTTAVETGFAQDYRGRVQGLITDPTQAAVSGASVTLRNINTGIEQARQVDNTGHYLFDFVQPGTYSVAVRAPGFQNYVQENVVVTTAGDVTVNAVLTVGGVSQTVNVTEEVSTVEFN